MPILVISVLSGPLQRASQGQGPGPDYANFGYFCIKRSTKSLEGPGPRFGQFWLFLYEAVLYKVLEGFEGLGPIFGQFWLFVY